MDPNMTEHRLLFLDFETYYDQEYSLTHMPPPNYILDQRFENIMCAVKEIDEHGVHPTHVVDGPDFGSYIAGIDPKVTTTVTFNSLFDNSILAWRYNFVPAMMLDAMGMARALRGHQLHRSSLAAVSRHLGLGEKPDTLVKMKGKHRQDLINEGLWQECCNYAMWDCDAAAGIFFRLTPEFPSSERKIMDLVLRCAIEPTFRVDTDLLRQHLIDLAKEKDDLLLEIGKCDDAHFFLGEAQKEDLISKLQSAAKFKLELERLGVPIQYKTSPAGKLIPAFAKTDEFMEELSEHEDIRVQNLVAARLGHKSTIEETRSAKLLSVAELPWAHYRGGNMGALPVPLRYGGAHTHRLSGDWGMNLQNLPTKRGSKGKSKLRNALLPPPDHVVMVADLGQIEARLVAWICGATVLLKQFADKLDPYAKLATNIFGFVVVRSVNIAEGFIGKTGILGLGYGCGAAHFDQMVLKLARAQGVDISKIWSTALAQKSVKTYRTDHHQIPTGWGKLDFALQTAWLGKTAPVRFGPVEIGYGYVKLPNGVYLRYERPSYDAETNEFSFYYGRVKHKLYGAKFLENIVQALARIIIMNVALRLEARGFRFRLQAHDELAFFVHKDEIESAKKIIHEEMVRPPTWAPDLPLTADVGYGSSYGDAK